jgi:hypothetical protein
MGFERFPGSALAVAFAFAFAFAFASGGPSEAATTRGDPAPTRALSPTGDCSGHAACTANFFIDVIVPSGCAAQATCTIALKLVATGDYHVNDEYPYRFKADEVSAVRFEGADGAGKNVFSKLAGDWQKSDAKSGVMSVKFTPLEKGTVAIAGTFKLSVCSPENCLLEQRKVSASVVVK